MQELQKYFYQKGISMQITLLFTLHYLFVLMQQELVGKALKRRLRWRKDKELIDRVGNKFKHASTLEHLNYTFYIQGISRACLQEVARHRHTSPSVKSTRYTLKELRNEAEFKIGDFENASRYLVLCGNEEVDNASIKALENLRTILQKALV